MKLKYLSVPVMCGLALISACTRAPSTPSGPAVTIDIAPLTLPGVVGVEYALAVFNAPPSEPIFELSGGTVDAGNLGQLVWNRPSVTSNRFGNGLGGDVSYVGPCDASEAENWVALALRQIDVGAGNGSYDGVEPFVGNNNVLDDQNSALTSQPGSGDGVADFVNPCTLDAPCVMKFRCAENADTPVNFNLTVMRRAEQGFFDIAVDLDNVFCSMKVDTCYADNDPIELLFDDAGDRVETAVVAAACSAGAGEGNTAMWMGPVTVTCAGGVSFTIDPTGDDDADPLTPGFEGNHETDAAMNGNMVSPGLAAFGTLTLSEALEIPIGVSIDIPAGTIVTRSDNGLDYVTATGVQMNASNEVVTVAATAASEGSNYNGASAFLPLTVVASDGTIHTINVTGAAFTGGLDPTYADGIATTIGYGTYWGEEMLECGGDGTSCNKVYWSVAINIRDLADAGFQDCRVTAAITASEGPAVDRFENGTLTGPGQTYGYVQIDAPLLDGNAPSCIQGPMGSEHAQTEYGSSADMLGSNLFPNLCYFFERGAETPRSLGDIDGYFRDLDGTPDSATYGGRIQTAPGSTPLDLTFSDMGGDDTGLCRARVRNMTTAIWFDGAAALEEFAWEGSGGTGRYQIDVYTRNPGAAWILWGGYEIDLRVDTGRIFFASGGEFPNAGDDQVAIVLTRLDDPFAVVDDIILSVGPPTP